MDCVLNLIEWTDAKNTVFQTNHLFWEETIIFIQNITKLYVNSQKEKDAWQAKSRAKQKLTKLESALE